MTDRGWVTEEIRGLGNQDYSYHRTLGLAALVSQGRRKQVLRARATSRCRRQPCCCNREEKTRSSLVLEVPTETVSAGAARR
jgi:hypothetical protein